MGAWLKNEQTTEAPARASGPPALLARADPGLAERDRRPPRPSQEF